MLLNRVCFRSLERMLWIFLVCIVVITFWVGSLLDDPSVLNPRRVTQVSISIQNQTTFLKNSPTFDGEPLWTSNPVLPEWMKEYMDWHSKVVATLHPRNYLQYKYLILRCYRKDERCGGVSDRLKPVPLVLLAAQRSKRILLIDWDRPCSLQEFLVPPVGGFQWGVPSFLIPLLHVEHQTILTRARNLIGICQETDSRLLFTHLHDTQGGMTQYDEEYGPGSFQKIYHDLFRVFFQPSPAVQRLIDRHLVTDPSFASNTTLVEGQYSVAHFRAEYGREIQRHPILTDPDFLQKVTLNAIRCASELYPTIDPVPIYFASDNPLAMETARQLAKLVQYPIITFQRSEGSPKKLDDYDNQTLPRDYYSTFVDLYLAGSGRCVTHGRGGFGRFASLLSFNATCSSKHVKQFFPSNCPGQPPFDLQLQNPA